MAELPFKKKEGDQGGNVGLSQAQGGLIGQGAATQVGPGGIAKGGGGWTNIQDYLKANAGSTGTADYIKKDVIGGMDTESKGFQEKATKASDEIGASLKPLSVVQDFGKNLSSMAGDFGKAQNRSGGIRDYSSAQPWAKSVQDVTGGSYKGPQTVDFSMSGKTQELVNTAQNNPNALLASIYKYGGISGPGMNALQSNLDLGNVSTQEALTSASTRAGALKTERENLIKDTDAKIAAAKQRWIDDPAKLKSEITRIRNEAQGKLGGAVNAYNDQISSYTPMAKPSAYSTTVTRPGNVGDVSIQSPSVSIPQEEEPGFFDNLFGGLFGGKKIGGGAKVPINPPSSTKLPDVSQTVTLDTAPFYQTTGPIMADINNISQVNPEMDDQADILNLLGLADPTFGQIPVKFSDVGPRQASATFDQAGYQAAFQNLLDELYAAGWQGGQMPGAIGGQKTGTIGQDYSSR